MKITVVKISEKTNTEIFCKVEKMLGIAWYWASACLLLACLYWMIVFSFARENLLLGVDRFALAEKHPELTLILFAWAFACAGSVGYVLRIRLLAYHRLQKIRCICFIVGGILLAFCCVGEILPPCELFFAQGFGGTLHQVGCAMAVTLAPFLGLYVCERENI